MNQAWRIVLGSLYESDLERGYYRLRDQDIDKTHPLYKETNSLSVMEFQGAIRFLDRNELIEDKGEGVYQLTRKGFDVARDMEHKNLQNMTNTRIAWFTFILALVEIVSITSIISTKESTLSVVALGVIAILLTALAVTSLFHPGLMRRVGNLE